MGARVKWFAILLQLSLNLVTVGGVS